MKTLLITMFAMLLLSGGLPARDDDGEEARYYDNAKVLRVKYTQGETFVQRSYDDGYEEATVNLPLFENDTVGTTDGRLEVYLGKGNFLRLDYDSVVQLKRVPELRKTNLRIRIEKGGINLDIANLDYEKDIEVQTPDCGVFVLDRGVYRINVVENRRTEVYVFDGITEVAGNRSSRNVRENQKIVMEDGDMAERPYYFYASEKDDFDEWCASRNNNSGYARYGSSRYMESGFEDYEYELSRSGRWSYMTEYGRHVWIPYSVNSSWRPYWNGRWVWTPHYGYVWTSYDSWGWVTHHYGRWHWDVGFGWYWIPGPHWSPAWVSWFWDNDYYSWCPMSYWNRPVIVINNHWDRHYDHRRHGLPHHGRSTVVIRKSEISAANISRNAVVNGGAISAGTIRGIPFHNTAPSDRPSIGKVAVVNANGQSVIYKRNGIVSSDKYQIASDNHGANSGGETTYRYNTNSSTTKTAISRYSTGGDTGMNRKGSTYSTSNSDSGGIRRRGDNDSSSYGSSSGSSSGSDRGGVRRRGESDSSYGRGESSSSGKSESVFRKSDSSSRSSSSSTSSSSSSQGSSDKGAVRKKKDGGEYSYGYESSGESEPTASATPYRSYKGRYSDNAGGSSSYRSESTYAGGGETTIRRRDDNASSFRVNRSDSADSSGYRSESSSSSSSNRFGTIRRRDESGSGYSGSGSGSGYSSGSGSSSSSHSGGYNPPPRPVSPPSSYSPSSSSYSSSSSSKGGIAVSRGSSSASSSSSSSSGGAVRKRGGNP